MDIIKAYPPNYLTIIKTFPSVRGNPNVVFTYGSKLYVPGGGIVSKDLLIHEETHERQQKENIDFWWNEYLRDPQFRLSQEVEAYGNQYRYVRETSSRQVSRNFLSWLSKQLASPIYGSLVNSAKAKSLIENYVNTAQTIQHQQN